MPAHRQEGLEHLVRRRFVEHDEARAQHDRSRHSGALLLSQRGLAGHPALDVGDVEQLECGSTTPSAPASLSRPAP
jgi:hypothetical protein